MSGDYSRPLSEFNIINIMLPTKYYPPLKVAGPSWPVRNTLGAALACLHCWLPCQLPTAFALCKADC